jgi:hypothetical protein
VTRIDNAIDDIEYHLYKLIGMAGYFLYGK